MKPSKLLEYALGINVVLQVITALVWLYRYIWFSVETQPGSRVGFLLLASLVSSFVYVAVRLLNETN